MTEVFLGGSEPPVRPSGIRIEGTLDVARTMINLTGQLNTASLNQSQIGLLLDTAKMTVKGLVGGVETEMTFGKPQLLMFEGQLTSQLTPGAVDAVTNALPPAPAE